ncbi:MAG TPA: hypothetical protein VGT82_10745, partial [Ktedonobacteraceae bacterium]|nr:hypothetical protein [Ktedonobacteraceae bacterium]
MNVVQILKGRREGELLAFPSVRHMADILSQRCREPSWVRTSVATLERFRAMSGHSDLELFLEQVRAEPALAEEALASFATALKGYTDIQVSSLAMGAKLWFRLNGVAIPWRPLVTGSAPPPSAVQDQQGTERTILLSLIGSGLLMAELLRLRLGDVGSLDSEGRLIPDLESDPLAVQFTPRRGRPVEHVTFLSYQARQALLSSLPQRPDAASLDLDAPLLILQNKAVVTRARQRSRSLIQAGSDTNVALCR